jgi:hypothetical protein
LSFNNNSKANKLQHYVYKHISYSFYSLDRDMNKNSITSCSRYQLIQFHSHNCMFGRTGFKLLNVLNDNQYNLIKLQAVKNKKFHSIQVCQEFRILTVFRSSTLVRALALPQRYWEQSWLCCSRIWKSWGKHELIHSKLLWYQVGSKYQLFVHCNFKVKNRYDI